MKIKRNPPYMFPSSYAGVGRLGMLRYRALEWAIDNGHQRFARLLWKGPPLVLLVWAVAIGAVAAFWHFWMP